MQKKISTFLTAVCAVLFFTIASDAQTTLSIYATGTAGSYHTGSVDANGVKYDGNIDSVSSGASAPYVLAFRGWAEFDLSALPAGATISAVTLYFTTYNGTTSSGASNPITGFLGDPSTTAGSTLYNDIASGTALASTIWTANGLQTASLGTAGNTFVQNNIGSTINIGFQRAGYLPYFIYGYPAATADQPRLDITFSVSTPCSGITSVTANGPTTTCAGNPITISSATLPYAAGYTFQWESSPGGANSWTALTGETNSSLTTTQTSATDYRVVVTCPATSTTMTSNTVAIAQTNFNNCYCPGTVSYVGNEDITNVTLGVINNNSSCGSLTGTQGTATGGADIFSDFTASTVPVPTLMQGTSQTLSVTLNTCSGTSNIRECKAYIDYNQNGLFTDPGEEIIVYAAANPNTTSYIASTSFTVPSAATLGTTRMRIILSQGTGNIASPCQILNSYGEIEDYAVDITALVNCTGTPTAGTVSGANTVCGNTNLSLTVIGASTTYGITYQWQSSPTGNPGTWSDIPGATALNFSDMQNAPTYYRMYVSCASNSLGDTTAAYFVDLLPFYTCYCASGPTTNFYSDITGVTVGSFTNTSACNTVAPGVGSVQNRYSNYTSGTGAPTPPQLAHSFPISFSVDITECNSFGAYSGTAIFIDYDQSGTFDAGEMAYGNTAYVSGNHTVTGNITIPSTTLTGLTGMRIVNQYYVNGNAATPCNNTVYAGETEDYLIDIISPPNCSGTPVAGTVSSNTNAVCLSNLDTVRLTTAGSTVAAGLVYQWQESPTGTPGSWTDIPGAMDLNYKNIQYGATYYRMYITCLFSSGVNTDTTNTVYVDMLPFYACYCSPLNGTVLYQYGSYSYITNVEIPTTTLNYSNSTYNNNGYERFIPPAANQTDTFFPGITYTINVDLMYPQWQYAGVWIDWDMDGTFDNSSGSAEWVTMTPTSNGATGTFTVPSSAVAGATGMRVRMNDYGYPYGPSGHGPCQDSYYGETEDYMIFIGTLYPCAGTPNPAIISGTTDICPSIDFTLTASGMSIGLGITYDWQYNDGSGWQTTGGANTTYTQVGGITVPTDYRLITYCANSNQYDTSNVLSVAVNDFYACYCSPLNGTTLYQYGSYSYITNVEVPNTTLSYSNSTYNNNGYEQFIPPAANQTDTFFPGLTYTINVDMMYQGQYAGVWIDWDMDGTFDNSSGSVEWVPMTGTPNATGTFTVPLSAVGGATGLRVRMNDYGYQYGPSGHGPCQDSYYGETEDYMIFIGTLYPCTGTPNPAVISGTTGICPSIDFTLVATGMSIGLGITYDWQYDDGSGWQTTGGAGTTYTQVGGITVPTNYRLITYCANSNQYDTSAVHSVAANDFYACYCSPVTDGTVLSQYGLYTNFITNVSIPSTTLNNSTTSYNSNGYQSFYPPAASATASLLAGTTYTLNVNMAYTYSWYAIGAWMDFDGDGQFDNNIEYIPLTFNVSGPAGTATGTFTIPAGAPQGMTGLRVRMNSWPVQYGGSGLGACGDDYQGEAEDYVVTILPPPTCIPPSGITATNITTNGADIGWTANNTSILQSELEYAPGNGAFVLGTGTRVTVPSSAAGFYSLGSLNSGAPYSVYIRDICSVGDTSYWSGPYTFFTAFPAIPANDDCTNAVDISDGALYYGSTSGATQTEPPCDATTTNSTDVWYSFTTGATGGTVNDTVNTNFSGVDVVVQMFSGTCGSLTPVIPTAGTTFNSTNGCVDGPAAGVEWSSYPVAANTTYYIRVYTFGSTATGPFSIKVSGTPLTIKLDKLTAVNVGSSNRVEWSTLSEERSDKFELERSADGRNFAKIYERQANGEASRYTYMDNTPVKGMNYYRLRMTEANGKAVYSEVVKAFVKSTGFEVDAFPNPVSHDLTVRVSGVQGADASVQVMDVTGKLIRSVKMTSNVEIINMSSLANGIYLIKYSDANHTQTIRVNKQ